MIYGFSTNQIVLYGILLYVSYLHVSVSLYLACVFCFVSLSMAVVYVSLSVCCSCLVCDSFIYLYGLCTCSMCLVMRLNRIRVRFFLSITIGIYYVYNITCSLITVYILLWLRLFICTRIFVDICPKFVFVCALLVKKVLYCSAPLWLPFPLYAMVSCHVYFIRCLRWLFSFSVSFRVYFMCVV